MQIFTQTPDEYVAALPPERAEVISKLRNVIKENIPEGFEEMMSYGMIGYVVPHSLYPAGYHCDPKLPLPFIAIASQKNSVNLYHMGINVEPGLMEWWQNEYKKRNIGKLDMGKSCIRFKKLENIPYDLIAILVSKVTTKAWIVFYETHVKNA
ncbi:DUF1801 domain-containing protein [Candidatus Gracilibacteria bacterium]|nr:DUF1801 domain-containing protein [Candidatus Gracilibacteria bacterium]